MPDEPEVLSHLKKLPPGMIYSLVPKQVFLRGFQYYQEERLRRLSWVLNRSRLKGIVQGRKRYILSVSSDGSGLNYRCNCPAWASDQACKHVVCLLLSLFNLLSPSLFKRPKPGDPALREALSDELFGKGLEGPAGQALARRPLRPLEGFELVVNARLGYPAIFVRKGGLRLQAAYEAPPALSPFTYAYYSDTSLRERFEAHLQKAAKDYPMVFEDGTISLPMEWDPGLRFEAKTELDISGDTLRVQALTLLNGQTCKKVRHFWDFVVHPESGKLGRVGAPEGWAVYHHLDQLYRTHFSHIEALRNASLAGTPAPRSFEMPLEIFQRIQLNISRPSLKKTLNQLVLRVGQQEVSPNKLKHGYRLTIDPDPESEQLILRAECCLGDSADVTSSRPFAFFTAINELPLPSSLRALKRLKVLYETFFEILPLKKKEEAARAVRKALTKGDFLNHEVKSAARTLLKDHFTLFRERDVRLRIAEGQWVLVPNEKAKEVPLYQIPYTLFGPKIFRDMERYNEMVLPARTLYEKLALLNTRLKAAGIELYFKKKPVATATWDFSFDAKRHSGIDWFELKPEIRCDGELVDERVWEALLQQRGIVEQEGTLQIVDANTQELLKTLALIYKGKQRKDPQKKEIVEVPRLQILDWIALRNQGVRVRLSDDDEALIQNLMHLEQIEKIPAPGRLKASLRPYQKEGLDWLAFLYRHRFGACLADDMGLGKTIQAIALLAVLKERKISPLAGGSPLPHLIVVPPTLLFNWEHEIARFYPELKVYSYVGKDRRVDFEGYDIVLSTYALIRRDISRLEAHSFHVIVFDEAQAVKNLYAETTGAVRKLRGLFKLVMTGTPVENHLGEYYSLIDLCLPGLLGDYDHFKAQIKRDESALLPILIRRTQPFVLRRMKREILKELPPKTETDLYLDLTTRQKALYQETIALIRSKIDTAYAQKTEGQAKIIALTAIMKLRQLCVSPRLLMPGLSVSEGNSPKMRFLIEQLQALFEEGHSALVFSQFTRGLDLLEEALRPIKIPYSRLDGSTPTRKRKGLVSRFQESTRPAVFLLSLKAGGQGLNLTKASYVFHLDPWWNPAVENQASDRAHRIGQANKVTITRILMRHTIEEKMMLLKQKKLALYEAVMGHAEEGGRGYAISKADFDFLLGA